MVTDEKPFCHSLFFIVGALDIRWLSEMIQLHFFRGGNFQPFSVMLFRHLIYSTCGRYYNIRCNFFFIISTSMNWQRPANSKRACMFSAGKGETTTTTTTATHSHTVTQRKFIIHFIDRLPLSNS